MNTVHKNNSITKLQLQKFVKNNSEKLGLKEKNVHKILKYVKSKKCTKDKIRIFKKVFKNVYILKAILELT